MKINRKAHISPLRILATIETVTGSWSIRLAIVLLLASLLVLSPLNPAASDRRGGDDGSGVGGTGILDLPGTGLGGSGLRPFLGLVLPHDPSSKASLGLSPDLSQEQLSELSPEQLLASALPERRSQDEIIVIRGAYAALAEVERAPNTAQTGSIARVLDNMEPSLSTSERHSASLTIPRIEGFLEPATTSLTFMGDLQSGGSLSILESIENSTQDNNSLLALGAKALFLHESDTQDATDESTAPLEWKDIARWLNANAEKTDEVNGGSNGDSNGKIAIADMARATGLRRPQLPSLQRARPLQRAAVLPPRIRPLGL